MDPKHQFAAQYVLSRAAAERREREILASSSLGIKQTPTNYSSTLTLKSSMMFPSIATLKTYILDASDGV